VSIFQSLTKILDPDRALEDEAAQKVERERPRKAASAEPLFICRVCKQTAASRDYCPHCLADTMNPLPTP
jgi:rubrerythrin